MNRLAVITVGKNTSMAFHEQLSNQLGGLVDLTSYYVRGNIDKEIAADLILYSSKQSYEAAQSYVRPEIPYLIARRSISYHEVGKVLEIPAGTHVLLVNESLATVTETIALLEALGINHIKYHPYYPGIADFPHLANAITPGEMQLVPDCVTTAIDIKIRCIDITTLIEILKKFSLMDEKANLLSAAYIKDFVNLIKQTQEMANLNNRLTRQLQTLINVVQEGIIALDEKNRISYFNPAAEALLGMPCNEVIGRSADGGGIVSRIKPVLTMSKNSKERFLRVNDHQLIVNAAQIEDSNLPLGRVYTLRDVTEIQRLEHELRRKAVAEQDHARYHFEDILGDSDAVRSAKELARKIARSDAPILIQGESGTGKEYFAQSIHNASARKGGPFIAVNFAALSESLLESELFGYTEGSFTGAKKGGCPGLFEEAHKGTIFLDEIGDAPLHFQIKLLRVLQERQIRRIGSGQVIPIDVRIITATNRDLQKLIAKEQFRQDLFYRLNVLSFTLPPLRDRKLDIPVLIRHFYNNCDKCRPFPAAQYFEHILPHLLAYDWPGNVRELQNVIEYMVNICPDIVPGLQHLPQWLTIAEAAPPRGGRKTITSLQEAIFSLVSEANMANVPIGRRTLTAKLGIPESQVRQAVAEMTGRGLLVVRRGCRGLEIPAEQ